MVRRPPRSTRNAALFPAPTRCRSAGRGVRGLPAAVPERPRGSERLDRGGGAAPCPPLGQRVVHPRTAAVAARVVSARSEEHTSELQSLMRISYAVFCLKKKKRPIT